MISNSDIEKILDRADIVDVISGFVELKRAGARYKAWLWCLQRRW